MVLRNSQLHSPLTSLEDETQSVPKGSLYVSLFRRFPRRGWPCGDAVRPKGELTPPGWAPQRHFLGDAVNPTIRSKVGAAWTYLHAASWVNSLVVGKGFAQMSHTEWSISLLPFPSKFPFRALQHSGSWRQAQAVLHLGYTWGQPLLSLIESPPPPWWWEYCFLGFALPSLTLALTQCIK